VGSRDRYQESNRYSSLAQARGLVALFVLTEVRFDKKKMYFTFWVLIVEIATCQPYGAKNFEVTFRVLENLCTTGYETVS